ncbi:UDP-N-acetylenolpyruvoylglucosamine reductase [Candidatus Roizmanbacteria bacterium RIFCSPHIGHO2_01_FULL_39_24]|uniref:UDP-N-acetylenolpyruvoylglucosamine reductase n=1 Tax=Candidatus Roizmanbacteria bacterium RIFCSPHIGHO2_01_FULL_39_24 TaxID=1802032 RepID=A0A1F7GK32_9BACT|nr:MAG: UDP-N-acetylenolpyruvoylglucosamine reductase [Candidatus Roizmanbacteria bacterium RIFCSPHIGHO2_01_FULL_39_24]
MNIHQKLESVLGEGRVKADFILAPYTTFKMGGPAQYYFEAETLDEIVSAVKAAHENDLKLTILGGISNVVISDIGVKGLVVRNRFSNKEMQKEDGKSVLLKVTSGYPISILARETAAMGLSGLEYHLGLPGTVGGALCMNSKWTKPVSYVGDALHSALLINSSGNTKIVNRDYFNFSYDYSILQETHELIGYGVFKLTKMDPQILVKRAQDALEYRKKTQPFGVASSGCFFQNIDGESAGKLIDELGFKGYKVGGLEVSDVHANFIINNGNGTVADFKKIVESIKEKALREKGMRLQEEIKFID